MHPPSILFEYCVNIFLDEERNSIYYALLSEWKVTYILWFNNTTLDIPGYIYLPTLTTQAATIHQTRHLQRVTRDAQSPHERETCLVKIRFRNA